MNSPTPTPITDDEIDRTALDIMRWGYRDTARRILEYKQELQALRANVGEPVGREEILTVVGTARRWDGLQDSEHVTNCIMSQFAGRRISHE